MIHPKLDRSIHISRIIEIGNPARLSISHGQLVIDRSEGEKATVPIEDIGALILDHSAITHTQQVLSACALANVAVIVCDHRHMPVSVLLPMEAHSLQAQTIGIQVAAKVATKKRLWQSIVRAKISEQAKVLQSIKGDSGPLMQHIRRVRSGDPENLEAQAARVYWPRLFGAEFRRDPEREGINSLLNYGYAVMRAAVARALVGAGLHPTLGLHHHNQYNAYALADDLVEPLRPLVDVKVYELAPGPGPFELDRPTKQALLECLTWECVLGERRLPLMVALNYYAASLRRVLSGADSSLEIPRI